VVEAREIAFPAPTTISHAPYISAPGSPMANCHSPPPPLYPNVWNNHHFNENIWLLHIVKYMHALQFQQKELGTLLHFRVVSIKSGF
jgi:hypothetical protein